uniref:Uncharacterized protein n=1 Tax=Vespula pensylvanica TaxID=30213 RepID=A0A834N3E9_VESPE|nr:hypothetical protein H0235_016980 [Vespula pensylvanica]
MFRELSAPRRGLWVHVMLQGYVLCEVDWDSCEKEWVAVRERLENEYCWYKHRSEPSRRSRHKSQGTFGIARAARQLPSPPAPCARNSPQRSVVSAVARSWT